MIYILNHIILYMMTMRTVWGYVAAFLGLNKTSLDHWNMYVFVVVVVVIYTSYVCLDYAQLYSYLCIYSICIHTGIHTHTHMLYDM